MLTTRKQRLIFYVALLLLGIFGYGTTLYAQSQKITVDKTLQPGQAYTVACDRNLRAARVNKKTVILYCSGSSTVPEPTEVATLPPPDTATSIPSVDVPTPTQIVTFTAVPATVTAIPPTATPIAPTATLIPPTAIPATGTPVPTVSLPTVTPTPTAMAHSDMQMYWHAKGSHDGCPIHEHGDPPPQWVLDAGYKPTFDHVAGTPGENMACYKHTGFKGFAGRFKGIDFYYVAHWDFNPGGQDSRFHSYQMWFGPAKEGAKVSHLSGWLDYGIGNNTNSNKIVSCGANSDVRPIINVNQEGCNIFFETWYSQAGGSGAWSIDTGVSINPNYYVLRPGGSITDPSTWTDTGRIRNGERRLEFAWYADRSPLRGDFITDQWGQVMNGMNDPRCGQTRTVGTRAYTRVCIQQFIDPSLTTIAFPGNAQQRVFDTAGVQLPN